MPDYQQRVLAEKNELDGKIERLNAFLSGASFTGVSTEELNRMMRQLEIMRQYSNVLAERLGHFVS